MVKLKIKRLFNDVELPKKAHESDAGIDLRFYLPKKLGTFVEIKPGERVLLGTGISVEIPMGYEIQVRPRSGLASKYGITVLNTPGTIDADYRGEIKVILINHGSTQYNIYNGDKIAQMVLKKLPEFEIEEVTELSDTKRGEGGFGSTGK